MRTNGLARRAKRLTRTVQRRPASPEMVRFARGGDGGIELIFRFEVEVMDRLDESDGAGFGAHHYAVGHRAAREKSYATQVITGGDAGGGEHHVIAGDFLERELVTKIKDSSRQASLSLAVVARGEPALHLAAGRAN